MVQFYHIFLINPWHCMDSETPLTEGEEELIKRIYRP